MLLVKRLFFRWLNLTYMALVGTALTRLLVTIPLVIAAIGAKIGIGSSLVGATLVAPAIGVAMLSALPIAVGITLGVLASIFITRSILKSRIKWVEEGHPIGANSRPILHQERETQAQNTVFLTPENSIGNQLKVSSSARLFENPSNSIHEQSEKYQQQQRNSAFKKLFFIGSKENIQNLNNGADELQSQTQSAMDQVKLNGSGQ
jgi:hypothetical protein